MIGGFTQMNLWREPPIERLEFLDGGHSAYQAPEPYKT